jgi:DNA-binding NarL/FixJ family response regulator
MQPTTLYIVEDHLVIRDLLVLQFKEVKTYRVIGSAADGQTACADVPKLNPQVVILDLELPDMTGIEVAYRLMETAKQTRVLIFTGATQTILLQAAIDAKVSGIVRKAGPLTRLLTAIDTVAAGKNFYDETLVGGIQNVTAAPAGHASLQDLTAREYEIFRLVANGRSNKEIASDLGISVKTAENHRKNLMQKLGTKNTADLTREAFRLGILR